MKKFIERGGTFRVIADISYSMIEQVRQRMEAGEEVRHLGPYHGMLFAVIDRTTSFHAINVDIKSLSLNEPLAMLWSDDPVYAGYLVNSFGLLWEQAVPTEARIQELFEQGLPQTDQ